jgi:type IV fimbrial biogenesis protein FimT
MRYLIYKKNKTKSREESRSLPSAQQIQRGFTIIELMITLAVAAIIISIAVPSFKAVINNNRVATTTNEMIAALGLARSEAIKVNRKVQVKPATGDWQLGYDIKIDTDGDDAFDDESVLRMIEAPHSSISYATSATQVTFNPLGGIADGTSKTFGISAPDAFSRKITVSFTGITSLCTDTASETCP